MINWLNKKAVLMMSVFQRPRTIGVNLRVDI